MRESVAISYHRPSWISLGSIGCAGGGLVFSADCAPADIVGYFSIDAGPIHCLSSLCLHHVYPLMDSVQVSKGAIEGFWGNADVGSLEEEAGFYRPLILGSPEMSDNPPDLLPVVWPTPKS